MPTSASWFVFGETTGLNQRAQPLLGGNSGTVLEAENLGFFQKGALVQRFGGEAQEYPGPEMISWLGRFINLTGLEELWAADQDTGLPFLRRRVSGTWNLVTFTDNVSGDVLLLRYITSAALGSKFFLAYDNDVNRLHVWDGDEVRRVGFAQASAVTAATMGGAGNTFNRWYRKRVAELDADGTIIRMSEPSETPVNVSIIDDAGVTVTRGTVPGEGETHWIVEAAIDESGAAGTFYQIATVLLATTTSDDTTSAANFPGSFTISPLLGAYVPPPSAKFLLADFNRLVMAGAWESTAATGQTAPKQNRVWYTPVLGSTDTGDDERIPNTVDQKNYIDIGDEGPITALAGPIYGDIYVFKNDSMGKLVPTGDVTTPYRYIQLSIGIGAVNQRVTVSAEQGEGVPALFFASASGVYMITQGGITELSDEVSRDLRLNNFTAASSWLAFNPYDKTILAQTNSGSSELNGQYYQFSYDLKDKAWTGIGFAGGQSGWILGRGLLGIDTILGGSGTIVRANVVATNANGLSRLLLGGQSLPSGEISPVTALLIALGDVCAGDGEELFTAKVRVRKYPKPGHFFRVGCPTVFYRSPSGDTSTVGTLAVSYIRQDQVISTQNLTLEATDRDNPVQQKQKQLDGLMQGDMGVIDVRMTLSYTAGFASSIPPSVDAIVIPVTEQEGYAQ